MGFFSSTKKENLIMSNTSTNTNATTAPTRILRWPEVARRYPISKSYAYALQAKGLIPKPIKLIKGGRASGYLESEIDDWINNRVEEARGNASK